MNSIVLLAGAARVLVVVAAMVLISRYAAWARSGSSSPRHAGSFLVLLALVAVVFHFDFAFYPAPPGFMNAHDVFHYYIGSKYSNEVGYLDLYPCTVVADWENNDHTLSVKRVRNMEDYRFVQARDVVKDAAHYRALFSKPRWKEFTEDVAYFRRAIPPDDAWRRMLRDKGYNATPVWNMVAHAITQRAPTHSRFAMAVLVTLDVLLLGLAFAFVWRAFGRRTALFSIVFFGTVFMMAYGHVRGAFLRLDWLALLVMAMCMLKVRRYKTAGAMAAYAGMSRIFPLAFVFGLGAKWFWDVLATRRLNRRYVDFFLTFCLVLILLLALSLQASGVDSWRAFWTKIRLHDNDISTVRVGFKYVFLMAYKNTVGAWAPFEAAKQQLFQEHQLLWWGIQGIVILISLFAVRRLEDYETIPYSYVPVYFLTAPTFYYHAMLIIPLFLFLPKLDRPSRARGAVLLFGVSLVAYGANAFWPLGKLPLSFVQSCVLLFVSLYIMAVSMHDGPGMSAGVGPDQTEERCV